MNHWVVGPIVLPLLVAIALLLLERPWLRRGFAVGGALLCTALVVWLVNRSRFEGLEIYLPGNALPPAGPVLVLDKLATLVLALLVVLHLATAADAVMAGRDRDRRVLFQAQMLLAGASGAVLAGDLVSLALFWGLALAGLATDLRRLLVPGLAALAIGLALAAVQGVSTNLADLAERSVGTEGLALAALALWAAGFWVTAQAPGGALAGLAATAGAGRILLMLPVGFLPVVAAVLLAVAMIYLLWQRGQLRATPLAAAAAMLLALVLFAIGDPWAIRAALIVLILAALMSLGMPVAAVVGVVVRRSPTVAIAGALVIALGAGLLVSSRVPKVFARQIAATAEQLHQPERYITTVMGLPATPMLAPEPGL